MNTKGASSAGARPLLFAKASTERKSTAHKARPQRWFKLLGMAVIIAFLAAGLVRGLVLQIFTVPSTSMEPTFAVGSTVAVFRPDGLTHSLDRGDVVVIDGRGSFVPGHRSTVAQKLGSWFGIGPRNVFYTKRIIGIGGDRVTCCSPEGQLLINGEPLTEKYLADPQTASDIEFDVEVPPGRVWLMGDNRGDSTDSRHLLGRPGGGMIPETEVLGVVIGHGSALG